MPPVLPAPDLVQAQYNRAYETARRLFDAEYRYSGFTAAMTKLWDDYCSLQRFSKTVNAPDVAKAGYINACAYWSLYIRNVAANPFLDEPGTIPF